jgi:hypothetical protein
MATHWTLGGDATDPHRLAAFWALALGCIAEPDDDFEGGASIVDPAGKGVQPHRDARPGGERVLRRLTGAAALPRWCIPRLRAVGVAPGQM